MYQNFEQKAKYKAARLKARYGAFKGWLQVKQGGEQKLHDWWRGECHPKPQESREQRFPELK